MIGIGFVHFRTTTLAHLDAAWFTLAQQDFTDVGHVFFLDNSTDDDPQAIQAVLDRYPIPVPLIVEFQKHGDRTRTQSWSVNHVARRQPCDWLFFTRTDFLLDYDCLRQLRTRRDTKDFSFFTSYCQQMGCDAQLSNTDVLADHSKPGALWRQHPDGPKTLIGQVPAYYFQETAVDAGVWLTRTKFFTEIGGLNERMVGWGFQQQVWQRLLVARGVGIDVIPEYLFHHQHHTGVRDPVQAAREYHAAGGG